jgi:large subunit ribosomal protein L4
MEINLYNQKAESIGKVELPNNIFDAKDNADLVYQVVTSQIANKRQVVAHAKGRSEVRGGGKKPWKQKGTGRARHGSIRSPIWKGGGVAHGPNKEKNYKKKINKKMAKKALYITLASKVRGNELAVVDAINLENWKTKDMAKIIKNLTGIFKGGKTMLLVTGKNLNKEIMRVSGNLPGVDVLTASDLNALEVASRKNIVVLKEAIESIK